MSTASEMAIRLIDSAECQRALEQQAAICQPSELATPPAAVAKRPTKQDMHAASDVCGHTALQSPEKPGAETMRIKLIDAASVRDQQVFQEDAAVKCTSGHFGWFDSCDYSPPLRKYI